MFFWCIFASNFHLYFNLMSFLIENQRATHFTCAEKLFFLKKCLIFLCLKPMFFQIFDLSHFLTSYHIIMQEPILTP